MPSTNQGPAISQTQNLQSALQLPTAGSPSGVASTNLPTPPAAGIWQYTTDVGPVVSGSGGYTALRYIAQRAYDKVSLNQLPLIAAPTYSAAIVAAASVTAGKVVAHSNGQLMRCVIGGAVPAAQPTFSATAPMTDGTLVWLATGKNNNIQTNADVPTVSMATTAPGGTTLTSFLQGANKSNYSLPVTTYVYYGTFSVFPYNWIVGGTYTQGQLTGTYNSQAAFEFESDAPVIAIQFPASSTVLRYPVIVDDAPVETDITGSGTGGSQYYILTWAARKKRTYRVECVQGNGIGGVAVDSQSFLRPVTQSRINGIYLGDSYGGTIGNYAFPASDARDTLGINLMKRLGIAYPRVFCVGGGGYTIVGSNMAVTIPQALANNPQVGLNPALVVIQAGRNDSYSNGPSNATITAAAFACWQNARQMYPLAHIAVIGPLPGNSGPSAAYISMDAALQVQFTAWGDGNSSYYPTCLNGANQFSVIWGTGNIAATTGTGNGDFYTSQDNVHPGFAGEAYLEKYLAQRIDENLTNLGL